MNKIFRIVGGVFIACALNASVAAQRGSIPTSLREVIAKANQEGELLLTWSPATFGGFNGAKALEAAMNSAYGTNIRIKWVPGAAMPNVGNQIAIRLQHKLPSPTDAYLGASRNMADLLKYDLFQPGRYTEYSPDRLNSTIVERGTYVKVNSTTFGWSYNKNLAPSIPQRLEDFLKPEWKGKIATTSFAAGFERLAANEAWGKERTLAFAKKLSEQVAGFIRCNEVERLISGEFVALVPDCTGDLTRRAIAKGAPLVRVIAPDVPLIAYHYLAVPKNAQHPNAAMLFITFTASKEGQRIIREHAHTDLHLYPESAEGTIANEIERRYDITFRHADIAWQAENDEGNLVQQQVERILQRR